MGRVGLIVGYGVSRLARNNGDWYHLLDLAAVFDTLIADNDGVYHPRQSDGSHLDPNTGDVLGNILDFVD